MVKVAGIVCRRHKDGVGGKAGRGLQGLVVGRAGKGNVHLAGLKQGQHLAAAAGDDLNVNIGVAAVEAVQVGQQKLAGNGVAGANGQLAQLQLVGLAQLGLTGFQQPHGAADVLIQHLPLGGQHHAPAVAGEKSGLQLRLQLLDALADGGLADIQRLGGGGDVARVGHLFEHLVKLQFHRHKRLYLII